MKVPIKRYTITVWVGMRHQFEVDAHNIPEARDMAVSIAKHTPSGMWEDDGTYKSWKSSVQGIGETLIKSIDTEVVSV
jgi:hypothetical protein